MSLDIGEESQGLQLWAQIKASLDGLKQATEQSNRLTAADIQRQQSNVPRDYLMPGNVVMPATGTITGAFSLGGPEQGRVAVLRMLRIGGVTPTTTASGRADIFQSQTSPLVTGTNTAQWIDQASTLPLVGSYSSRLVVLHYPDKLWIVISSATASQQYVGNAQWEDYQEGAYKQEIEL